MERLEATDRGDVVPRLSPPDRDPATGVIAFERLVEASEAIAGSVDGALGRGDRPLVLGGDCSLLIGVAAALRRQGGDTGLCFVDGHADYYDGESSPTGESADMDLAIVHGGGPEELAAMGGPPPLIAPERTVILGHRPADLNPDAAEERARIPEAVKQMDTPAIRALGAAEAGHGTLEHLGAAERLWLHIDLDALDEDELPAVSYPQSDGLSWEELENLLKTLAADDRLIGASLADFNPDLDSDGAHASKIVEVLGRALAPVT